MTLLTDEVQKGLREVQEEVAKQIPNALIGLRQDVQRMVAIAYLQGRACCLTRLIKASEEEEFHPVAFRELSEQEQARDNIRDMIVKIEDRPV